MKFEKYNRKFKVTPSDKMTRLQFSTARIEVECIDGSSQVGTGFFYHSGTCEYFVTNKHVVEDALLIRFHIHQANEESPQYVLLDKRKFIETTLNHWTLHPNTEVDLAYIPVSCFLTNNSSDDLVNFYVPLQSTNIPDDELVSRFSSVMDVAMIGYPDGLWDEYNGLPIIRQGVTASHASLSFDGRDDVILDIACFPGSSGSPIILHNPKWFASTTRFLGVLYAGPVIDNEGEVLIKHIPTIQSKKVNVGTMMHLGFAIKSHVLQDFISELE